MERFLKYFVEIILIVIDDKNIKLEEITISHDFGAAGTTVSRQEKADFIF
jgi:hypothetical protein